MDASRGMLVLAAVLAGTPALPARAEAERGGTVEDVRMRTLDGGTTSLLEKGSAASVLVFFRAAQDRSVEALRAMGECQAAFAGKPVRFVGIVSDRDPPAEVRAAVAAAAAKLPVLLRGAGTRPRPAASPLSTAATTIRTRFTASASRC